MNIRKFRHILRPLFSRLRIDTVLDFGSGSTSWDQDGFHGALSAKDFFRLSSVCEYEPSINKTELRPADCVVSFDVLEHIPVEDVRDTIRLIFSKASKLVAINIASYPAAALLPTGENCHITIRPYHWWKGVFDAVSVDFPSVYYFLCVSDSFWSAFCSRPVSYATTAAREADSCALEEPSRIRLDNLDLSDIHTDTDLLNDLLRRGHFEDLASLCDVLLDFLEVDQKDLFLMLEQAYSARQDYDRAIELLQMACLLDPSAEIATRLMKVFRISGRAEEGLQLCSGLTSQFAPDSLSELLGEMAIGSMLIGGIDEARRLSMKSLSISPQNSLAHYVLGMIEGSQGNHDDAIDRYNKSIECDPTSVWPVVRKANDMLAEFRIQEAIAQGYQRRVEIDASVAPFTDLKTWRHSALSGSVMLIQEQGVGDQVFYGRFLSHVADKFSIVYCTIDPRLQSLFARSFPMVIFNPPRPESIASRCDTCFPIGDLLANVDCINPSMLDKRSYLRSASQSQGIRPARTIAPGIRIGISWKSTRTYVGLRKSVPLSLMLSQLVEYLSPRDEVFCLQHDVDDGERQVLSDSTLNIQYPVYDPYLDLDSHANWISMCDVVLTVSNLNAHMAGALGVPAFVLLPSGVGLTWYWGGAGAKPHWYEEMSLFRAVAPGEWVEPLRQACAQISKLF